MTRSALLAALLVCVPLAAPAAEDDDPGFNEATFKGLEWRNIGPALMSGRISDIVVHPNNQNVWYVGVGSGGVWKTSNAGTTWDPIFENEGSYSIGSITLDPSNPSVVWVGSGENVSGRHVGYGDGVYVSRNGGETWENVGLKDSGHIGMIRIDPRNSDVVFVAAQGPLWSAGGDRGLFKSTNGGQTWRKVLGEGLGTSRLDDDYTGVNEVHLDPRNPDIMYASSWQRLRNVAVLMNGGPGSGIHKSTDGGETWRELEEGLPDGIKGKIGLAISPQQPDVIYATIELANRTGGFWRSEDGGESWEKRNDYLSGGTGPHYYQELFASPHQFDRVYQMDVHLHVTNDGGENFERMESETKHVDHHAMAFDPKDENYLLVGNDGGVYESFDGGKTWRFAANLPVTQFYKVAVDYDEPFYNVYGGTQDNSSQGGPSQTGNTTGIRNGDWFLTLWADGHQSAVDPTNPDIVYANWQEGNLTRYDRRTGESVYIKPQPGPDEPQERYNWDAPILLSPHDPARLYFASNRVWRSDNRGDSWTAVSVDLTRNQDRLSMPIMERTWGLSAPWDLSAMSQFNTITSLSESPLVEGLLYVGTDDGRVQISEDGGGSWRAVDSLPGVPANFFVNDIKADLHDADTVYVVVDDHKHGDFAPYVLVSSDRGRSWRSISSNLPERHLVWRLVQDHVDAELLFVGTEFGVFFTVDAGESWTKLGGNVPNIPFRDLVIQTRENDLVGGTFGRGIYILDDYTALREVSDDLLTAGETLFPVKETRWYVPRRPLACVSPGCVDSQGDAYFVAPNPPFGAVLTYYLSKTLETRSDARREAEKNLGKENDDVAFPSWETIRTEELEDPPAIVFTVTDAEGNTVRHLEGPVDAGFHRLAWDLRYPALEPWQPEGETASFRAPAGALVAPGLYQVAMAKRTDGTTTPIGEPRTVQVTSIREPTLPGASNAERVAYLERLNELRRVTSGTGSSIDEVVTALGAIQEVLERSTASSSLYERANALRQALLRQKDRLQGQETRGAFGTLGPMSVGNRLQHAAYNPYANAYGPTETQRQSLNIARRQYDEIATALEGLTAQYQALLEDLDSAGVPWTPGRGVLRPAQ